MSKALNLTLDDFVGVTKALADTNRVRALCALRKGELCVCQIIELLGLAPSTISKHMSILKQAGLVDSRKDSRWVYYRLADAPNGEHIRKLITLIIELLESDIRISEDDKRMEAIIAQGLDAVCKKQRCS